MNPNIELNKLMVMQDRLRHTAQITKMVEFVKNGGFWTQEVLRQFAVDNGLSRVCPVMEVIVLPDEHLMIHDGHHRAVSIWLAGRTYLRGDEYINKYWTFEDYLGVNFKNRWVTPFDPRTQIRIPDIGPFKKAALDLAAVNEDAAREYIEKNKHQYVLDRNVFGIECLVKQYHEKAMDTVTHGIDDKYFRTEAI